MHELHLSDLQAPSVALDLQGVRRLQEALDALAAALRATRAGEQP
jgi:hypothetical protein